MESGRQQLRAWIDRAKLNQRKAARLLGVTDVLISQWLSGIRTPSLEKAIDLERHTGIQPESWLLTTVSESAESVRADARETPHSLDDNADVAKST